MEYIRKKKRFGQHFLHDNNILKKIAESPKLLHIEYDTLLEIGPGDGRLTQYLLNDKSTDLHLVEIDTGLAQLLHSKFPNLKDKIITADFLKLDIAAHFKIPFGIIGNFPYNISSQIIAKIIDNRTLIPELTGMFQKEMALRITAKANTGNFGRLSILAQAYYDTTYLFSVSRHVFNPKPKVESAVIQMKRKKDTDPVLDHPSFLEIVKQAFNQRRKKLSNSLSFYHPFFNPAIEHLLTKRAGELDTADFAFLTRSFIDNGL